MRYTYTIHRESGDIKSDRMFATPEQSYGAACTLQTGSDVSEIAVFDEDGDMVNDWDEVTWEDDETALFDF